MRVTSALIILLSLFLLYDNTKTAEGMSDSPKANTHLFKRWLQAEPVKTLKPESTALKVEPFIREHPDFLEIGWDAVASSGEPLTLQVTVTKDGEVLGIRETSAKSRSLKFYHYTNGLFRLEVVAQQGAHQLKKIAQLKIAGKVSRQCPTQPYWRAKSPVRGYQETVSVENLLRFSNLCIDTMVKGFQVCPAPKAGADVVTYVHFVLIKVISGEYPEEAPPLILAFPGGCLDGACVDYSHSPRFANGDRVILCLGQNRPHPVVGEGFLVKANGMVTDWEGRPVVGIDPTTTEIFFDETAPFQPKACDQGTFGDCEIRSGKKGKKRRCIDCTDVTEVLPASPAGPPMAVDAFIEVIKDIKANRSIPDLPAGHFTIEPFKFGPVTAVAGDPEGETE